MDQQTIARHFVDHAMHEAATTIAERPAASAKEAQSIAVKKLLGLKPPQIDWPDYLVMLLHVAASIEHALMIQYLYAAYTLRIEGKYEPQIKAWQTSLLMMAKEEMGHLLAVQNLLCLLRRPPYLKREDYPWDTNFYPFPFKLEPLTLGSVACYAFAEMPPDWLDEDEPEMQKVKARLRAVLKGHLGGKRDDEVLHHVGTLYGLIIEIFKDPSYIPDWALDTDSYLSQAGWDDWGRGYAPRPESREEKELDAKRGPKALEDANMIIDRMATRDVAIGVLKRIATQGEAPQSHKKKRVGVPLSHFERFLEMFQEYADICDQQKNPRWTPAPDMPTNPMVPARDGVQNGVHDQIDDPYAAKWGALFNLRYRILLTYLAHSFDLGRRKDAGAPPLRGVVMNRVFGEMYNLKTIAGVLTRLPLEKTLSAKRAGPPFQMPWSLELPTGTSAPWRLHLRLIRDSRVLAKALADDPGARPITTHQNYLDALIKLDEQAERQIDRILAAGGPSESRSAAE